MSTGDAGPGLRGRRAECEALGGLVASARAGQSGVLVLRGEAGIGKTSLLEFLVETASGCRIARAAGAEAEMELAFAGLHQLCGPMLDHLDRLPGPQREALATAFGLSAGDAPDRFLVGLAVLSLLSDVAEDQPLVCLIDDGQWLDQASAQTLTFVARRLLAEPICLVFAVRAGMREQEYAGLPELRVLGLSDADARGVLEAALPGPLDVDVRDLIITESRGNPLALVELPRGLSPAELAGGFGLPDTPVTSRIEQGFIRRLEPLPPETRQLLLLAAAEPVGDVALLWRAAARLGIGPSAVTAAEEADVIEFGARVRFRHPLMRSATYQSASLKDRQEAHRALGEVTDPDLDPDRRAWHRAHAAAGPDEAIAAELERSADRAQARGGLAAAAAFLERATALTPDPPGGANGRWPPRRPCTRSAPTTRPLGCWRWRRPDRSTSSSSAGWISCAVRSHSLRGGANRRPALLLTAARRLEPLDPALARDTYLDAFSAALIFGRLSRTVGEVARAARAAPVSSEPRRAPTSSWTG